MKSITIGAAVSVCCWYFFIYKKSDVYNAVDNNIQNSEKFYTINNDKGFISNNYEFVNLGLINNPTVDRDYSYIRKRVSDHNLIGFTLEYSDSSFYRIGHWNALNFSLLNSRYLNDKNSTQFLHADNIAKVIAYFNFDIIGLTEINKNTITTNDVSAAQNFLNLVNSYVSKSKSENYEYDLIVSDNTLSTTATSGQSEQVAILYNKKRLTNYSLSNNNNALIGSGYFYKNNLINWGLSSENKSGWKNYDYVRPPFGTMFKSKTSNEDLIVLFSHFDSPGTSNNETSGTSGMGKQEMFEANNIQIPLEEFKSVFKSENIVFMGDTNIPTGKQNIAFDTNKLSSLNYEFSFEDSVSYNTSLAMVSTVENNINNPSKWYSNAYDKIIYSLKDLQVTNKTLSTKLIVYQVFNNEFYLNEKKFI